MGLEDGNQAGLVLAYVLADHKDAAFIQFKARLEPFGIQQFYTDDWGAYERNLAAPVHMVGKANTQKIERKHLTFRTRIKRLALHTICFSRIHSDARYCAGIVRQSI